MITIIPAIDLIDGSCVRLTQGDYDRKTTYYKDPLDVARRYEDCGIKRLHLVDLDGAKASHPVNLKVLERLATSTALQIQYGSCRLGSSADERRPGICFRLLIRLSASDVCPRQFVQDFLSAVFAYACLPVVCVAAIICCSLSGILFRRVALWWGIPVAPDSFCRREQYGKTKRPDFNLKSGLSCGTTRNRNLTISG